MKFESVVIVFRAQANGKGEESVLYSLKRTHKIKGKKGSSNKKDLKEYFVQFELCKQLTSIIE